MAVNMLRISASKSFGSPTIVLSHMSSLMWVSFLDSGRIPFRKQIVMRTWHEESSSNAPPVIISAAKSFGVPPEEEDHET
jgi:hypothetical protein